MTARCAERRLVARSRAIEARRSAMIERASVPPYSRAFARSPCVPMSEEGGMNECYAFFLDDDPIVVPSAKE